MPYYNLLDVDKQRTLSTPAKDIASALQIFGHELSRTLTLTEKDGGAAYLLDEWHEGPHWVNPTIPVYEEE